MRLLILLALFFSPPQERTVLVCQGPDAYAWHLDSGCRGLARCSATIVKMGQGTAEKARRRPCGICAAGAVAPLRVSNRLSDDGQCTATTQKGSRCKRRASAGGVCWQH